MPSTFSIKPLFKAVYCSLVLIFIGLSTIVAQPKLSQKWNTFVTISDTPNYSRYKLVHVGNVVGIAALMGGLKFAWYEHYDRTRFHFFNDNNEWLQMDKVGHFLWNYNGAYYDSKLYQWAGMPRRKAVFIGAGVGFAMEMVIETLDGFSAKWGFSPGDFTADLAGSAILVGQELAWKEQRIAFKFSSFQHTYQPIQLERRADDLFGNNFYYRLVKDYNAITFWASFNVKSFLPNSSKFPSWLNVAVGYSAKNMFNGVDSLAYAPNGIYYNMQGKRNYKALPDPDDYILTAANHPRYRQLLFSVDVDLTKIKTKHKLVRAFLDAANVIKFPAPALEYNTLGQLRFHPVYF